MTTYNHIQIYQDANDDTPSSEGVSFFCRESGIFEG